jgi:hypothetical protein
VGSVADDTRRRTVTRVLELSVAARIELALTLGDDDLEQFMRTGGLQREEALRRVREQRARGRVPSAAAVDRR